MIEMNRDHDDFDLGMELCCCLGRGWVPLELLRVDLGLGTVEAVREVLDGLRERGYRFGTRLLPGAEGVGVDVLRSTGDAMRASCRVYWRVVYGAGELVAEADQSGGGGTRGDDAAAGVGAGAGKRRRVVA